MSYGSDSDFNAWMASMGYTLPSGSLAPAVLRFRGSMYIDGTYGNRFTGHPTGGFDQENFFPVTDGITTACVPIPPDVVPRGVVLASYFAAYQEAVAPGSLSVTTGSEGAIKREKVGQLEVEYAGASSSASIVTTSPILSSVDGLLAPYLRPDPNTFSPLLLLAIGE